ncbi:MAG: PEP-CTERM sorting domain-containing protein [Acidobacteria bacterium]|nr:PEP-CTERM sorting domain-containing protein [Acidobacteriota bacterium]
MNGSNEGKQVRRRRRWYRRRLRLQRGLLTATMLLLLAGACWQSAARWLSLPSLHASNFLPQSFWTRGNIRNNLALMSHAGTVRVSRSGRSTYPYSVIPGGVSDIADLREHAARDYVVRRHFAGFNYARARLVRSQKAREVYLSYRLRDRIFWTRKKVRLLEAELLITDGTITARARCGNQVSETPKEEVSDEEPAQDVLDEPVANIAAIGPVLPIQFLNVHPNMPGVDGNPPSGPQLFAGGFNFPYVDFGVSIHHLCKPGEQDKRCKHHHKPPAVPEPGSLLLIGSGLALVYWRYRRQVTEA